MGTGQMTEGAMLGLLRLLRDQHDEDTARLVHRQLQDLPRAELLRLLQAAVREPDQVPMAIEMVLFRQQWEALESGFSELRRQGQAPLEELLLMMLRFGRLEPEAELARQTLDELAATCASHFSPGDCVGAKALTIANTLAGVGQLRGNDGDYYNAENSFLDTVLSTRRGIPISLSCIYLLVGRRLEVPFEGIGLPGHFIVAYLGDPEQPLYFDPFGKGRRLTKLDCVQLVEQNGQRFVEEHLKPVTERYIFLRLLANLYQIYEKSGDLRRADVILRYGRIFST
jgi:regulator of sirC expression with transglutaminase-like and TPR domain